MKKIITIKILKICLLFIILATILLAPILLCLIEDTPIIIDLLFGMIFGLGTGIIALK